MVARSTHGLRDLAGTLADASDPDGLGARMKELYVISVIVVAQVAASVSQGR
jgi:hypothetical protein